jgi:hypothetical protein
MKELQVGDVLYSYQYGYITGKIAIDRVTAKRAYAGNIEFKKQVDDSVIREMGAGTWNTTRYRLEDEQCKADWERKTLLSYVKAKNPDYFSTETLKQLAEVYKNGNPHKTNP